MILDDKEKILLQKLRNAGKKESKFSLTLSIDNEVLATREFSAEHYSKESIVSTRTHFLMNDLIRLILKQYDETEKINQEEKKREEIEKMWNEKEKKENGNNK